MGRQRDVQFSPCPDPRSPAGRLDADRECRGAPFGAKKGPWRLACLNDQWATLRRAAATPPARSSRCPASQIMAPEPRGHDRRHPAYAGPGGVHKSTATRHATTPLRATPQCGTWIGALRTVDVHAVGCQKNGRVVRLGSAPAVGALPFGAGREPCSRRGSRRTSVPTRSVPRLILRTLVGHSPGCGARARPGGGPRRRLC